MESYIKENINRLAKYSGSEAWLCKVIGRSHGWFYRKRKEDSFSNEDVELIDKMIANAGINKSITSKSFKLTREEAKLLRDFAKDRIKEFRQDNIAKNKHILGDTYNKLLVFISKYANNNMSKASRLLTMRYIDLYFIVSGDRKISEYKAYYLYESLVRMYSIYNDKSILPKEPVLCYSREELDLFQDNFIAMVDECGIKQIEIASILKFHPDLISAMYRKSVTMSNAKIRRIIDNIKGSALNDYECYFRRVAQ